MIIFLTHLWIFLNFFISDKWRLKFQIEQRTLIKIYLDWIIEHSLEINQLFFLRPIKVTLYNVWISWIIYSPWWKKITPFLGQDCLSQHVSFSTVFWVCFFFKDKTAVNISKYNEFTMKFLIFLDFSLEARLYSPRLSVKTSVIAFLISTVRITLTCHIY